MRRLVGPLTMVLVAALVGGCTSGDPAVVSSSSPSVTVSVEPTPQWTDEEQAAIDAVQRYIDVWTSISHDPNEVDWEIILDFAWESVVEGDNQVWTRWADEKWHLVGSPTFIPDWVNSGAKDDLGARQHVHGCFVIESCYIADDQGVAVPASDRIERGTITYTVIRTADDLYSVSEIKLEDKPC